MSKSMKINRDLIGRNLTTSTRVINSLSSFTSELMIFSQLFAVIRPHLPDDLSEEFIKHMINMHDDVQTISEGVKQMSVDFVDLSEEFTKFTGEILEEIKKTK